MTDKICSVAAFLYVCRCSVRMRIYFNISFDFVRHPGHSLVPRRSVRGDPPMERLGTGLPESHRIRTRMPCKRRCALLANALKPAISTLEWSVQPYLQNQCVLTAIYPTGDFVTSANTCAAVRCSIFRAYARLCARHQLSHVHHRIVCSPPQPSQPAESARCQE